MPPWALENPRLFVKVHRQALESDVVREGLSHWIDLVFGYKQKGRYEVEIQCPISEFSIQNPSGKRGML